MSNDNTVTIDTATIIQNAQTLYGILPRVGFTLKTFEELGRSAGVGIPFGHLSQPLKIALFTLVRELHAAGVGPAVPPRQDDVVTPELTPEELADQARHVDLDEQANDDADDAADTDDADDEPEEVAATATTTVTTSEESQHPTP
jgi:hypothetical protein